MNAYDIRYTFEHVILPQWFFEGKGRFVELLVNDDTVLYRIINDIFKNEAVENPYKEEQFKIEISKIIEEVMMIKIILPYPEDEPLCYWCYLFFNKQYDKLGFFSIEKGNNIAGKTNETVPFLCSWTADGAHNNYGSCSIEDNQDFIKCADIYMTREYGLKR